MKKAINIFSCGSLVMLMLLTGCAAKTLFMSDFSGAIGQPPLPTQTVGTASVSGDPGSVVVVGPPVVPSGQWVQIGRSDAQRSALAIFQGNFVQAMGTGIYNFTAVLNIPSGSSNVASIQFDPFGSQASDVTRGFLHLDFLQDNRVRINDDANTSFGSFPRDRAFVVTVNLNITASNPTAHISLTGAGGQATGDADYAIVTPVFISWAQQIGAVQLWMGFPWTGVFEANDIIVTYRKQ